ncbi:MAG: four helix bundle protein [Rickettsiales bacterium]|jgi:four helix bundle protein|nr:four helix bundle protein [Rickettsiales bacterium]
MKSFVGQKSEKFALRIINLCRHLHNKKNEFVLSKQILRSGTSIGANLAESDFSISKKEYLAKIYIAIKECSETLYWLRLLRDSELISQKEFCSIYPECEELGKLLSKSIKTIKKTV